jgi:hypothetical protein
MIQVVPGEKNPRRRTIVINRKRSERSAFTGAPFVYIVHLCKERRWREEGGCTEIAGRKKDYPCPAYQRRARMIQGGLFADMQDLCKKT